jgi:hypothetical protein
MDARVEPAHDQLGAERTEIVERAYPAAIFEITAMAGGK